MHRVDKEVDDTLDFTHYLEVTDGEVVMLIAICDELSSRKQSRLFKVMHPFSLLRLTDYGVRELSNRKGSLEEKKNLTISIEMLDFCIYGREDSSDSECSYESPSDSEIPLEIHR